MSILRSTGVRTVLLASCSFLLLAAAAGAQPGRDDGQREPEALLEIEPLASTGTVTPVACRPPGWALGYRPPPPISSAREPSKMYSGVISTGSSTSRASVPESVPPWP